MNKKKIIKRLRKELAMSESYIDSQARRIESMKEHDDKQAESLALIHATVLKDAAVNWNITTSTSEKVA